MQRSRETVQDKLGTTARPPDLEGDAYTQTKAALAIIATALGEVGAQLSSVVT